MKDETPASLRKSKHTQVIQLPPIPPEERERWRKAKADAKQRRPPRPPRPPIPPPEVPGCVLRRPPGYSEGLVVVLHAVMTVVEALKHSDRQNVRLAAADLEVFFAPLWNMIPDPKPAINAKEEAWTSPLF